MAIDSGEIGAAGKIVSFQSAVDARRMYLTLRARNIKGSIDELDSSRRAPRGTVRVYSTVAGLLCQPSKSEIVVGIPGANRKMVLAGIDVDARLLERSFESAYFTASTLTSF